jgi:hypothetical protein
MCESFLPLSSGVVWPDGVLPPKLSVVLLVGDRCSPRDGDTAEVESADRSWL